MSPRLEKNLLSCSGIIATESSRNDRACCERVGLGQSPGVFAICSSYRTGKLWKFMPENIYIFLSAMTLPVEKLKGHKALNLNMLMDLFTHIPTFLDTSSYSTPIGGHVFTLPVHQILQPLFEQRAVTVWNAFTFSDASCFFYSF